jgi:hypothetical protein
MARCQASGRLRLVEGVGAALLLASTAGCATIISGETQRITLRSVPPGATVTVEPEGIRQTTPGEAVLQRKDGPYRVRFEKDCYYSQLQVVGKTMNPLAWVDVIVPGFALAVDLYSGAFYRLTPSLLEAKLAPANACPPTESAPSPTTGSHP